MRFKEVDAGELVVGTSGVVAFWLWGDGVAGDDCSGFMDGMVRVLLRLGEITDVFSYEYCCNAPPKLGESASLEVIFCKFLLWEERCFSGDTTTCLNACHLQAVISVIG